MTNKHERIQQLRDELTRLETEIEKEKKISLITQNVQRVDNLELNYYNNSYYLSFYTLEKPLPTTFVMNTNELHNFLTLIHKELEEAEIPTEDQELMKLLDHFFHINNFKPINLKQNERYK